MRFFIFCVLTILWVLPVSAQESVTVEYQQDANGDYYANVEHSRGKVRVRLCSAQELDKIEIDADIYRSSNSCRLYNLIVKPIEKYLKNTVYFKPAGKIHFINLAAVTDDHGRRCCQKYHLRRISDLQYAIQSNKIDPKWIKMYLFGGMVYDAHPERLFKNCWWVYRDDYWGGENGNDQSYHSAGAERLWYRSEQLKEFVKDLPGWNMNSVSIGTAEDGTRAGYKQLVYSRGEIKFIYNLRTFNVEKFTGDKALEELFKLRSLSSEPSILHISTHSFTIDTDGRKTAGLLFSGAAHTFEQKDHGYEMNDGLLYAEEIVGYDFSNVELLVLSACGTALGTVTNDGVVGLLSAFKDAGAKTIIATLWSINDRAAAEFMKIFYSHMVEGKSKYEAFDLARKAMIDSEDFNDPHYWAPFIMLD